MYLKEPLLEKFHFFYEIMLQRPCTLAIFANKIMPVLYISPWCILRQDNTLLTIHLLQRTNND